MQDYRFIDSFLVLLGSAVASADALAPRLRLARFIGEIAGEENTYFLRAFDALGVTEEQRREIPDTAPTTAFTALFPGGRRDPRVRGDPGGAASRRVALPGLGVAGPQAAAGELRARGLDHAARLSRVPPDRRGLGD